MADDVLDADLGGLFFALLEQLCHLASVDFCERRLALLHHAQTGDGELECDFELRLRRGLAGIASRIGGLGELQ